jgi:hypothetical protein
LLSSCNSRFVGRRKPGGGYTFYDSRQGRSFDMAGPNPTPDEMSLIDKQYSIYLADIAKAKLLADEAARQAAIAEAEEQADFERRKQIAKNMLTIQSINLECKFFPLCGIYRLNINVINRSNETISEMNFGWAFSSSPYCPSAYSPSTGRMSRFNLEIVPLLTSRGMMGQGRVMSVIAWRSPPYRFFDSPSFHLKRIFTSADRVEFGARSHATEYVIAQLD